MKRVNKLTALLCVVLAGGVCFSLVSCNEEKEENEITGKTSVNEMLSYEELRESFLRMCVIPRGVDTMTFDTDKLEAMLDRVGRCFLNHDCCLIISLSEDEAMHAEWITVPCRTESGQYLLKQISLHKKLKYSSFSDKDYSKVSRWAKSEIDKGNIVLIAREQDGSYTAISYTQGEWALLNMRF